MKTMLYRAVLDACILCANADILYPYARASEHDAPSNEATVEQVAGAYYHLIGHDGPADLVPFLYANARPIRVGAQK